jgi:hypothetical protein
LLEPRPDLLIVARDPARPCALQLHGRQRIEFGRQLAAELGQNRPRFTEADESGRRDGERRA